MSCEGNIIPTPEPNIGLGTSVVNLSDDKLSEDEISVLSKGLTFVPTPQVGNLEAIKASVNEFNRKLKCKFFFGVVGQLSRYDGDYIREEFTEPSAWEPPDQRISAKVHEVVEEINERVGSLQPSRDKNNLSFRQVSALKNLKAKKHLVIKKADKGSACVVMNKTDYVQEAHRQLDNGCHYTKIEEPIYPQTSLKYKKILQTLKSKGCISEKQLLYLAPKEVPRPRRFYLLPKIHKDMSKWTIKNKMPPGRPIVSDCSSESYRIAEYLDKILQPLSNKHASYIKNTDDFLEKVRNLEVPENAYLITLDIESLYTNIQTKDGIEAVEKMFRRHSQELRSDKEVIELLKLSLECNDFQFNGEWYLQTSGTAMGKKFAPAYANIMMAIFEEEVLERSAKKPLAYYRYLDDIFIIWPHTVDEFEQFFHLLNNHRESIKFQQTISDTSIDFLDVTIYKGNNYKYYKKLDTKVFFKPTDTHELLHKSSFHPKHTFAGIIKSQLIRYWKICSDTECFNLACSTLFRALRTKRNYSVRFLRQLKRNAVDFLTACRSDYSPAGAGIPCQKRRCECCLYIKTQSEFTSTRNGANFTITGKLDCNSKNILYLIECSKCEEQYVGETERTLRSRLNNHLSDIRNYKETGIAEHFNQLDHIAGDLQITPIVQIPDWGSKTKNKRARTKQESWFIKKLDTMTPNGMNERLINQGTLAFPVIYSKTGVYVSKIIREAYEKLYEKYPDYYSAELVIAYKRNPNLSDMLTSSKLR